MKQAIIPTEILQKTPIDLTVVLFQVLYAAPWRTLAAAGQGKRLTHLVEAEVQSSLLQCTLMMWFNNYSLVWGGGRGKLD